jgi:hypothetical protein
MKAKLFIPIFFFFVGCQMNSSEQQIDFATTSQKLGGNYIFSDAAVKSLKNDLIVFSNGSKNVYSKASILQFETPTFNLDLSGKMEIINFQEGLILKNENEIYFIGLQKGSKIIDEFNKLTKFNIKTENRFFGYGLSFNNGSWDLGKLKIDANSKASNLLSGRIAWDVPSDGNGNGCTSGGEGASSCSISDPNFIGGTACSVTCEQGYYACCKTSTTTCTCVKK